MNKRLLAMAVLLAAMALASGCGSLSLFSSRHVHYHGSEETDNKVSELEKRVEALENSARQK